MVDFGNGPISSVGGYGNGFLAKYTPQNSLMWLKTLGNGDIAGVRGMAVDSQDNVIVTGIFHGTLDLGGQTLVSSGSYDAFVAKYDNANPPNLVWAKHFGGQFSDLGYGVAVDASNDVFVIAGFQSSADFGGNVLTSAAGQGIAVVKLRSSDGATLWAKGTDGAADCGSYALAVDRSGNVWITGQFAGIFVAKYSGINGNVLWNKATGITGTTIGYGIATDPNTGNVFVTGTFSGTADFGGGPISSGAGTGAIFLAAYDPSGTNLWTVKGGGSSSSGPDIGMAVKVDGVGNLALTGAHYSPLSFGGSWMFGHGYFLEVFTISGNTPPSSDWSQHSGNTGAGGGGNALAFDTTGHLLTGGWFSGITDFGGGPVTASSAANGFLVQYMK